MYKVGGAVRSGVPGFIAIDVGWAQREVRT